MKLKLRDIVIAFIALILAVILFNFIWSVTALVIRYAVLFVVAYILFLFLKKIL